MGAGGNVPSIFLTWPGLSLTLSLALHGRESACPNLHLEPVFIGPGPSTHTVGRRPEQRRTVRATSRRKSVYHPEDCRDLSPLLAMLHHTHRRRGGAITCWRKGAKQRPPHDLLRGQQHDDRGYSSTPSMNCWEILHFHSLRN